MHQIRLAQKSDQKNILIFIKENWSNSHIFVQDKLFFDYHYQLNDTYNFYIAINKATNEICGILGYINYNPDKINPTIFLSLWQVIKANGDASLGLKMLNKLQTELNPSSLHCTGINKKTINIYKFMGYHTGKMNHYCIFNNRIDNYQIAKPDKVKSSIILSNSLELVETESIDDFFELQMKANKYSKSLIFLKHRYENHPYYKYKFYTHVLSGNKKGATVVREITIGNRSCLRVIDVANNSINTTDLFVNLTKLFDRNCEYIDLYTTQNLDISEHTEIIKLCESEKNIIVPNYFEPFDQKNIDIYFFSSLGSEVSLYKGDGDQDRPNIAKDRT